LDNNTSEDERSKNRRVEINLYYED
jgi:flagellar motor protein MotB